MHSVSWSHCLNSRISPVPMFSWTTQITISWKLKSTTTRVHFKQQQQSRVILSTLKLLEWDKLCDVVSSFAATPLGRHATMEQLWWVDQTYDESLRLQRQTRAVVDILNFDPSILPFSRINLPLVKSAVSRMLMDASVDGRQAIAVANLLQFSKSLQINIKDAFRGSNNLRRHVEPIAELIADWPTNDLLVRSIRQVINEDGYIKDSASPKLKQARGRVAILDTELCHLMNSLIAKETSNSSLEASKTYGRWCIRSETGKFTSLKGLLVSSGTSTGDIIEPISAVPLNDKLQEAEAIVAEAEAEVLLALTAQMKAELDSTVKLLNGAVELDIVYARANYSLSVKGTFPDLVLIDGKNTSSFSEDLAVDSPDFLHYTKKQWIIHLPQAYHPLLVEHHKRSLEEARKDLVKATSMGVELFYKFRSRKMQTENIENEESRHMDSKILQAKVTQLEKAHPTPVDFLINNYTRVALISGPNMGGKTVCLKTLGLAAIMAKTGLCVLCSEPAQIPWFEFVFADIGDQQSLAHSLSTFSGHLKQINEIQAMSTSQSLVLLDEIGTGTNPREGAALGISVLESFSVSGALLTVATTHNGEIKTHKYCNKAFENASMEFDGINLKPTYKILWGLPGHSKAFEIAERLGMLETIVSNARELYGPASIEIDEVIFELEKFRQDVQEYLHKAKHFTMVSENLSEKLLLAQMKLIEHHSHLTNRKVREIAEIASRASSILRNKIEQHHASELHVSIPVQPLGS